MNENRIIKCLVVDDEPPAREIISRYISNVPMLQLAGECSNAIQAMSFLQDHTVDLLFLDIRMPQLNGNDLLKILKQPPRVILTTAYAEYALEGYDLDVSDYLLKPVQFERFLKAVLKATQHVQISEPVTPSADVSQEAFAYFRADRKMVKLMLKDILYIESMKDYIKVFTKAMLPKHLFIRTHRSFIVAIHSIRSFTSELIEIAGVEIPIGKLFRNEVLKNISLPVK